MFLFPLPEGLFLNQTSYGCKNIISLPQPPVLFELRSIAGLSGLIASMHRVHSLADLAEYWPSHPETYTQRQVFAL